MAQKKGKFVIYSNTKFVFNCNAFTSISYVHTRM